MLEYLNIKDKVLSFKDVEYCEVYNIDHSN